MDPKIEKLIIKYITKIATAHDLDVLSIWIEAPNNTRVFKDYIQTHYAITYSMNDSETDRMIEHLLQSIRKEKSLVHKLKKKEVFKYAAAAVLIGVLATGYFFKDNLFNTSEQNTTPVIVNTNNKIHVGTDKAILTLGDGSTIILEKGKTFKNNNIESTGEQIVYNTTNTKKDEVKYNYLTTARGGEYFIKLSDGTQVWLNSVSQLKYPEVFVEGETRRVELVYGEAYFDVSPSTSHKGSKFNVRNQKQDIEVLGTAFNIKAYKDETNIYTTLVEGRVVINYEGKKQNLAPNQQSSINTLNANIEIYDVDVESVISWKNGVFSFKGKPLKDIMKVLSRWYDVDVIFMNKDLESLKFKGVLSKGQSIDEILAIMKSNTINDYEIRNKTIIIK